MIEATPALLDEAVAARREKHRTFWRELPPRQDPAGRLRERPSLYVSVDNFLTRVIPSVSRRSTRPTNAELAALDEKIAALGQAV